MLTLFEYSGELKKREKSEPRYLFTRTAISRQFNDNQWLQNTVGKLRYHGKNTLQEKFI